MPSLLTLERGTMNKQECIDAIRETVPEGSTVFVVLEHVSASRMTRWLKLYYIVDNSSYPVSLDYWARTILDVKMSETHDGLRVTGFGLDVGQHILDSLGRAVYGNAQAFRCRWL